MQYTKTTHEGSQQSAALSNEGWFQHPLLSPCGQLPQIRPWQFGFSKEQYHCLQAQIVAFGFFVRGDWTLPLELLLRIAPPPQEALAPQVVMHAGMIMQNASWKSYGPMFDVPFIITEHTNGSTVAMNNVNNMALTYDVKDLLTEEKREVINRKKTANIEKIGDILAVNCGRKMIRPDLIQRLQIEQKKLRLLDVQARLRDEIEHQQQEIKAMPIEKYKKFVRFCDHERTEHNKKVQASKRAMREKELELILQWHKKFVDIHRAIRDARTARNKGVGKYHDRLSKEFSKAKDDHHRKRMEALKNNDLERYKLLLEQQSIHGDGAERYTVLSLFLTHTEKYLRTVGSKITAAKAQQEVEEASNNAAAAARDQGLSEANVRAAAACAKEEAIIRNSFSEMNKPIETSTVNEYYNLAHAVNERVSKQPSMLQAGILRDYQLVGLQWMLSLYNNKLNGILADEMGLGKTVQVMSLIAYLMEYKANYGPHLIIVPNAVLVNWKSELHKWLPSVSCIYYVGGKDERSKLFAKDVAALKFNVLVTTYEFIMNDRSKLSKVDWKYIIIDEAQRMKDRESVLARDLDQYRCQRRLLLTGTPLQNDLKELWSLMNLLLPEVFDNFKAFGEWFSKPSQKEGNVVDDWLEAEKKVIVIHRLHQILEPFMLRRLVEDVEGSLPLKVSVILRCKMSPIQSAVYDCIKSTGTIRVDPECERLKTQKKPTYQAKVFRTLHNRCMELRKTCNHPLLNYPRLNDFSKDFLVKSCGKLFVLDRILLKLQRTGHRVLLFSTMTKLLDILEDYLQWRQLVHRRIDGTTSLEERESSIDDFNSPNSECFIFLLSIRAAGRGLNLQSADTVIIYDPDPNPKNEEQAVARAHRIGQKREVRVIYLEAVVDKISSHQTEDRYRSVGVDHSDDELEGKDHYMGSIESLIRNTIQQSKIEIADEIINAGRFDLKTTHEERRLTLESMLHDEDRYQEIVHNVPSLQEVNRMIARGEEEVTLFDQMDKEFDWVEQMTRYDEVPKWLCTSMEEVNATMNNLSRKPSKQVGPTNMGSDVSLIPARTRGKKIHIHTKHDYSQATSEERSKYSGGVEDHVEELKDIFCGGVESPSGFKADSECDSIAVERYEKPEPAENYKISHIPVEACSAGSSLSSKRSMQSLSSSRPSRKCGSVSNSDVVPSSLKKRLPKKSDKMEDVECTREKRDSTTARGNITSVGTMMSDAVQHRLKKVLHEVQWKIEKEHDVAPKLTAFWKRYKTYALKSGFGPNYLDIQRIEQRLDKFKYKGVIDLVSDVRLMLQNAVDFYQISHEVQVEAKKVIMLLFDLLQQAFPEMDFKAAREAIFFNGVDKHSTPTGNAFTSKSSVSSFILKTSQQQGRANHPPQQQAWSDHPPQQLNNRETISWTNPAKRRRTDIGLRRPRQMM